MRFSLLFDDVAEMRGEEVNKMKKKKNFSMDLRSKSDSFLYSEMRMEKRKQKKESLGVREAKEDLCVVSSDVAKK